MLPFIVGAATLSAIYSTGRAYDNYRYWHDYAERTGHHARYPWRSGRYDNFATASRYMWVASGLSYGNSYIAPKMKDYDHYMYG